MPDIPPFRRSISNTFLFFVPSTQPLFICPLFLSRVSLCYPIVSGNRKMADSQLHAEVHECHYE